MGEEGSELARKVRMTSGCCSTSSPGLRHAGPSTCLALLLPALLRSPGEGVSSEGLGRRDFRVRLPGLGFPHASLNPRPEKWKGK